MALRKVVDDDRWWAERPDGSWVRWSHALGDWEPHPGPPPGYEPPPPPLLPLPDDDYDGPQRIPEGVIDLPVSSGTSGIWDLPRPVAILLSFLGTYVLLAVPTLGAVALIAAFWPLIHLFLLFMGGTDASSWFGELLGFVAIYLLFASAAFVIARHASLGTAVGLVGWIVALAILLVGSSVAARISGLGHDAHLLAQINRAALLAFAMLGVHALLRRIRRTRIRRRRRSLFVALQDLVEA